MCVGVGLVDVVGVWVFLFGLGSFYLLVILLFGFVFIGWVALRLVCVFVWEMGFCVSLMGLN